MNKQQRKLETLLSSLKEYTEIEHVIEALPRGYISVKQIAGHTYYYRQWREGSKVVSCYVPESSLSITEQKIRVRKENEQLLKVIKKSYKSALRSVLRAGLLTEQQVEDLKTGAKYDEIDIADRKEFIKDRFKEANENTKKAIQRYVDGEDTYNRILIVYWNI